MQNKLYQITGQQLQNIQKIHVIGDIHGDYFPFTKYLDKVDIESNLIIFLGDYADRGIYGVETIYTINNLITKHPDRVLALKGNHEDYMDDGTPVFNPCDLVKEVIHKKGNWQNYFKNTFSPFLEKLYLAILLPGEILFVHGGISSRIQSIADLNQPSPDIEKDVLWSDPFENSKKLNEREEYDSFRGLGVLFGKSITAQVLQTVNARKIIRSHQPRMTRNGIHYNHDKQVITINSTSVYDSKPFVLVVDPAADFAIGTEFI